MRSVLLLSFVFLSWNAQAGLLLDVRLDGQSQNYDDAATRAGIGATNFRYLMKTARLDYTTKFNEKTNARARLILNTDQGAVNKRDSLNNFVDLFFVQHQVADPVSLTAGKFSSDMNGWEHQTTSADVYYFSQAYTGGLKSTDSATKAIFAAQTGKALPASWTWDKTGTTRYYTGVKLSSTFSDQQVSLHHADLTDDDVTSGNPSQTRTLLGVVYKGSFLEKFIQPLISYHTGYLPNAPSGSTDAKVQFTSVGLRFNWENNALETEYLTNEFHERTVLTNGEKGDDSIRTALLNWVTTRDNWTLKAKLESSALKVAETEIYTVTGYGLAVEWKPVIEEGFRYHLAYNNRTWKPGTGDTANQQEIMAGLRIAADLLK